MARPATPSTWPSAGLRPRRDIAPCGSMPCWPSRCTGSRCGTTRRRSPATSGRRLRARKPKVVFIEGPSEANDLIPHVIDARTEPPVAIYSSYRDDDNVLGLNGIASPAAGHPGPVRRLVSADGVLARVRRDEDGRRDRRRGRCSSTCRTMRSIRPRERGRRAPAAAARGPRRRPAHHHQRVLPAPGRGRRVQVVGRGLGHAVREPARRPTTRPSAASWPRSAAPPGRPPTRRRRQAPGTVERERHFLKVIRETLAARKLKPEDAAVVCGGFHLFLDRDDADAAAGAAGRDGVHDRRAVLVLPRLGDGRLRGRQPGAAVLPDVLRPDRRRPGGRHRAGARHRRPAADAQGGRPALDGRRDRRHPPRRRCWPGCGAGATPTLDDIDDALVTCCCKGDPAEEGAELRQAMDAAGIGNEDRQGHARPRPAADRRRLPRPARRPRPRRGAGQGEEAGRQARQARAARRPAVGVPAPPAVPRGAVRGDVGHRRRLLRHDLPRGLAAQVGPEDRAGPDRAEPLRRHGRGRGPGPAARGDRRGRHGRRRRRASGSCRRWTWTCPTWCRRPRTPAAGRSTPTRASSRWRPRSTTSACSTATPCSAACGATCSTTCSTRCYDRACFALPDAAAVPEEEQNGRRRRPGLGGRAGAAGRRRAVRPGPVRRRRPGARPTSRPSRSSAGRFLGLLCEIRELPADALAAEVAGLARAAPERMVTAGDLLDGMLAVSRTSILLGADALVAAVDDLLKAAEWDPFLVMLPRLRAAFERLPRPSATRSPRPSPGATAWPPPTTCGR